MFGNTHCSCDQVQGNVIKPMEESNIQLLKARIHPHFGRQIKNWFLVPLTIRQICTTERTDRSVSSHWRKLDILLVYQYFNHDCY